MGVEEEGTGGGDGCELTLGGVLTLGADFGADNGLLGGSGSASKPASGSGFVAFESAETGGAGDRGGTIGSGFEDAATSGLDDAGGSTIGSGSEDEEAVSELLPTRPPSVAVPAGLGKFTGLV
jgi:hypothetical protein